MTKDSKTKDDKSDAERQAIFKAELAKLALPTPEKPMIQPVASNSRFSWSVFQVGAGPNQPTASDSAQDTIRTALQDRYDHSDES